jgi:hypothetical protein
MMIDPLVCARCSTRQLKVGFLVAGHVWERGHKLRGEGILEAEPLEQCVPRQSPRRYTQVGLR